MPSRFLAELGYKDAGNFNQLGIGSAGYQDNDGDDLSDFGEEDFDNADFDPFPDDVPVWE